MRSARKTAAWAWLLILVLPSYAAAQDLVGLYATWKRDPATTITINWVDLYPASSREVWYRELDESELTIADVKSDEKEPKKDEKKEDVKPKKWTLAVAAHASLGPSTLQVRRAELSGLKPDTTYEFGIGRQPTKPTEGWRVRTMPQKHERTIRFVTGGDMMHSRATVDAMNKQVQKLEPDFALLGGDLAYANGVTASRWVDWLQSWMTICVTKQRRIIPMVLAIGNHEVRGGANGRIPDDAPYFYGLFSLPEDRSYYGLDFGDYLSLVVLDSGHTHKVPGAQAEWLGAALAARSKQKFLFACYHYPAYGTTKAPKDGLPIDAPRSLEIQQHWTPHFDRFGCTAVFENDHHTFKRTHRLRARQRDDENGILYLGDGAWGVGVRAVPKPSEAWWLAKAESRNHLWHAALDPSGKATLEAIDVKGEKFDAVELAAPRTKPVEPATVSP
ncbi:MAG: metallophosphoesterase [Pirellulales bacterium]